MSGGGGNESMISPIILPLSLVDPKAARLLFWMGEIMATGRSFWMNGLNLIKNINKIALYFS